MAGRARGSATQYTIACEDAHGGAPERAVGRGVDAPPHSSKLVDCARRFRLVCCSTKLSLVDTRARVVLVLTSRTKKGRASTLWHVANFGAVLTDRAVCVIDMASTEHALVLHLVGGHKGNSRAARVILDTELAHTT